MISGGADAARDAGCAQSTTDDGIRAMLRGDYQPALASHVDACQIVETPADSAVIGVPAASPAAAVARLAN